MAHRMKHGVILPQHRAERVMPARVMNARSKKRKVNTQIRLDRLLRSSRPKICIKRRLGGIGDVIMTTPLTKAIKMLLPHCHLIYATDTVYSNGALAEVIKHNPFVDQIIPNSEIVDSEYDYCVDVTTTGLDREKSGTIPPNRIDMFAEEAGVSIADDPVPIYIVTEEERNKAKDFINKLIPERTEKTKIICIQARSNDARRTWPLDYVQELADIIAKTRDLHVFLFDWGSTIGRWIGGEKKHLLMDIPLQDTAAIVEQSDLVVCPDSSMLHLAGALNKKIVSIFGPIPPESRINHYANAIAIVKENLPCRCWYSPRCTGSKGGKLECLVGIKPNAVFAEIQRKIVQPYKPISSITYGSDLTNKGQDPIILVRRTTSGIGDMLMATPALDALKTVYNAKELHVACNPEIWPALKNNPSVSKLIDIARPINNKRYYIIIDVSQPCARYEAARITTGRVVQKSRVEIFAEAMGVRDSITSIVPRYYVSNEESIWAENFLHDKINPNKPTISIGLKSAEQYRNWPEYKYQQLFKKLHMHFNLVLLHHSREYMFEHIIDACNIELRKSIAILSKTDGLITVDTSLLHFGAALNIPTIALFGPIDYKARCKGYSNVTALTTNMDCSPCWRNAEMACNKTGFVRGYSKCMESIPPKQVAKIAIEKFKGIKNA